MKQRRGWKTVLFYLGGVLILAAAIVAAWFLPELYGQLQDEKLLGNVNLSTRENIEFLDVDSLDIQGRLKMLGESRNFRWDYAYLGDDAEKLKECCTLVSKWQECGLLPEQCISMVRLDYLMYSESWRIYLDQGMLDVYMMSFRVYQEQITGDQKEAAMTIVMDQEKEMIYYASVSGELMMDFLVQHMGYDSVEQYWEENADTEADVLKEDLSRYDFATPCGALSAELVGENAEGLYRDDGNLNLDIQLSFDTFACSAYRREIMNESDMGVAIMYGTLDWMNPISMSIGPMGDGEVYLSDVLGLAEETTENVE